MWRLTASRGLVPIVPRAAAVALLAGLAACSPPPDERAGPRARDAAAGAVVELAEPVASCGRCLEGYYDFTTRRAMTAPAVTVGELNRRISIAGEAPAARVLRLERPELDRRIREALAIGDILAGLETRPLTVGEIRSRSRAGLSESRLRFEDPEVGSFEGILLLPAGPGPHPAVLALHGHREDAAAMADEHLGRRLAERGFAVLIPEQRAFDCSRRENKIAIGLLAVGRTLLGLHVYEALLMARYLEHRADIDGGRIALLGHSGGSTIANLAARVSDSFVAKVTDYRVDFRNHCGPRRIHCETVPSMVELRAELEYEGELGMPYLEVPYKFENEAVQAAIFAFLDAALGIGSG